MFVSDPLLGQFAILFIISSLSIDYLHFPPKGQSQCHRIYLPDLLRSFRNLVLAMNNADILLS